MIFRPSMLRLFALALVVAALSASVFGFMWLKIGAFRTGADTSRARIADERSREASLKATKALLAEAGQSGAGIESYLLPDAGVASFIESLEKGAKAIGVSGFALRSVAIDQSVAGLPADTEGLRIEGAGEGTWSQMLRFTEFLESQAVPLSFANLSLTQAGSEKGVGHWSVSFAIVVSKLKP